MAGNNDLYEVRVGGLAELNNALLGLTRKLRRQAIIKALRAAGRVVLTEARARVPTLSLASSKKTPYRNRGTVKKALTVRVSRQSAREGNLGVFINVKPAAGAKYQVVQNEMLGIKYKTKRLKSASKRGAKSPNDPFYWRFLEFGTAKMAKRPFIQPASEKLEAARLEFERVAILEIQKLSTGS